MTPNKRTAAITAIRMNDLASVAPLLRAVILPDDDVDVASLHRTHRNHWVADGHLLDDLTHDVLICAGDLRFGVVERLCVARLDDREPAASQIVRHRGCGARGT